MRSQSPGLRATTPLLWVLLTVSLLAVPAAAHAEHQESQPRLGERLEESPTDIWIRFTEQVEPSLTRFTLLNTTRAEFPLGELRFEEDDFLVRAAVPEPLPPGGYALRWETISTTDGHKTTGAVPFGVQATAAEISESGSDAPRADAVIGKTLAFIGLTMVAGAFAFWYLVLPRGFRKGHEEIIERYGFVGAWMQMAGLLLFSWSQLDASGLGIDAYFVGTAFGRGLFLRLFLAFILLVAFNHAVRRPDVPRPVWAIIGAVAVLSFVIYGNFSHTAGLIQPRWIGVTVDALHLLSVATWTGALAAFVIFLKSLPQDREDLAEHLKIVPKRFSDLATISVFVVAATGVFLMWAVVGFESRAWTDTTYGRLLALKVALAVIMMILGGANKLAYVGKYVRGGGMKTLRAFRNNVQREVALGIAVFILAGLITNMGTAPEVAGSQAEEIDYDAPYLGLEDRLTITADGDHYEWTVQFHPEPALGESTHYIIEIFDPERQVKVTDADWVELRIHHADDDSLDSTVAAGKTRFDNYEAEGAYFPVAGEWTVEVVASTDRGRDSVAFQFVIK